MRKQYKQRLKVLNKNGFGSYEDFLASDLWHTLKQKAFATEQGKKCYFCSKRPYTLHHVAYTRVNRESLDWLLPICKDCHDLIHKIEFNDRRINTFRATRDLAKQKGIYKKGVFTRKWFKTYWYGIKPIIKKEMPMLEKEDKREFSLKIVKSSELPATLHHSLQTIVSRDNYTLKNWVETKEKKGDYKMLGLFHLYEKQAVKYLSNMKK